MDVVEPNRYKSILQPAYLLDVAPCDFLLFPNLKKDILGHHFQSNEEMVAAVENETVFFISGLIALEHLLSRCLVLENEEVDLDLQ